MNWLDLFDIKYNREGNRPNRGPGGVNIPYIDKRNKKDVDAFNKKHESQGITLIPDSVGEQGQKRWKVLEDVQGKSILSDEQLKRFGTRLEHSKLRKDLEKDYPSDGSNRPAGTDERLRTSEAFAEAALNDSIVDGNQHTVAGANALASNKRLIEAAEGTDKRMGQSPSKGSVGRNYARIQEITTPVEQKADATKGTIPVYEGATQNPWDNKAGALSVDFNTKSPLNITELPKGIDLNKGADIFNPANIDKMPSFAESIKASEAMGGAGWAAGLQMASKFLGMMQKKQKAPTPGISPSDGIKTDDDYLTALAGMKFYD